MKIRSLGFTLLELIVVLTLIAAVTAIFVPMISRSGDHYKLSTSVRDLTSAIRYTRSLAIETNSEQMISFGITDKTYQIEGSNEDSDKGDIDKDIDIEVFTAEKLISSDGSRAAIKFYPDGTSTGGRVTLTYSDEVREIDIVWMTGFVRVLDDKS